MIPACSHVGTPRHFQSSTTSGTAWVIVFRTFARASPRQSPRSTIRSSMSDDGDRDSFAFAAGDFSPDAFFAAGFLAGVFLAAVDFLAGGMPLLGVGLQARDHVPGLMARESRPATLRAGPGRHPHHGPADSAAFGHRGDGLG